MELQEVLEKRKSVRRHYLQKPVERKLIKQMIYINLSMLKEQQIRY